MLLLLYVTFWIFMMVLDTSDTFLHFWSSSDISLFFWYFLDSVITYFNFLISKPRQLRCYRIELQRSKHSSTAKMSFACTWLRKELAKIFLAWILSSSSSLGFKCLLSTSMIKYPIITSLLLKRAYSIFQILILVSGPLQA